MQPDGVTLQSKAAKQFKLPNVLDVQSGKLIVDGKVDFSKGVLAGPSAEIDTASSNLHRHS